MLANGYLSHWELTGLKPYMRYTLAGGFNYEEENVGGPAYPVDEELFIKKDVRDMLDELQEGLMNSPGHRRNILSEWHKKVNLGVAFNSVATVVVQQFEGNYISFDWLPGLADGMLRMSGTTLDGLVVNGVQIRYDQTPHSLTLGQLGQTYSYASGIPVAFVRPPPPPGAHYTETHANYTYDLAPVDPYEVDPNTPAIAFEDPPSSGIAPVVSPRTALVPWVDANVWTVEGSSFSFEVDLATILFGNGVYTVAIWGEKDGESKALTNYSIFVE